MPETDGHATCDLSGALSGSYSEGVRWVRTVHTRNIQGRIYMIVMFAVFS